MKNQSFFPKLKKILAYPFQWKFIRLQQKTIDLLDKLCNSYLSEQQAPFNTKSSDIYQELVDLRNNLNKCWNLHDVTQLLKVEINHTFEVAGWLNIPIFDKKTGWFVWKNIFEWADRIDDPGKKSVAHRQLRLLQQISSTFDLGK